MDFKKEGKRCLQILKCIIGFSQVQVLGWKSVTQGLIFSLGKSAGVDGWQKFFMCLMIFFSALSNSFGLARLLLGRESAGLFESQVKLGATNAKP